MDAKRFGVIPGVTDREYYTNSFHVPVYYPISAFNKLRIEAPYHALTNGGHISYIEMDGDPLQNLPAFEKVVRFMGQCGIGYGSINHPVDRDPVCGYTGIIGDTCPRCGAARRRTSRLSVSAASRAILWARSTASTTAKRRGARPCQARGDGLMRIAGTVSESIVDGPGLRLTVFTQGCPHHCPGCHNPQTHDRRAAARKNTAALLARYAANPLLDGITLSGGEPMEQVRNAPRWPRPCTRWAAMSGFTRAGAMRSCRSQTRRACGCWRLPMCSWTDRMSRRALSGAPLARKPKPAPHRPERDPQNREAHPANGIKKLLQHNRCSSFLCPGLRKALIYSEIPIKCPVAVAEDGHENARVRVDGQRSAEPIMKSSCTMESLMPLARHSSSVCSSQNFDRRQSPCQAPDGRRRSRRTACCRTAGRNSGSGVIGNERALPR